MLSSATRRRFTTRTYKNLINGQWVESKGPLSFDVINPATQELVGKVPQSSQSEFDAAVKNAKETFKTWKEVPISTRVRYMLKYQELLKQHQDKIAALIT